MQSYLKRSNLSITPTPEWFGHAYVKWRFIPSTPYTLLKVYCHYLTPVCHNLTKLRQNASDGDFFLEGGFQGLFAIWSISSHVGVQIGLELVRLIALICLNKFWTNVASPKSLKKFSRTTFRWSVVRKWSFLVFQ